jgi:hypothetical protein
LIENQALLFVANRYGQTPLDLCSARDMFLQLNGSFFFNLEFVEINLIQIDLAKEQGQDGRIIPFEEHNRYSTMPMFDIMGSSSTQSVIDIRELQFEKCLHSNHRKEVYTRQS